MRNVPESKRLIGVTLLEHILTCHDVNDVKEGEKVSLILHHTSGSMMLSRPSCVTCPPPVLPSPVEPADVLRHGSSVMAGG